MGCEGWEQKVMRFFMNPFLRVPFYIFTLTILSLLLPLSFLFLARLSYVKYPPSYLLSPLVNINLAPLLQSLLSFFSVTALVHGLTDKLTLMYGSVPLQPRLHIAWIFLSAQVTVGFRIVFFIGLHETMLHWGRTIVRPVVDDTLFGDARSEKWIEKVAISAGFGGLWLWSLRDEVEMLVLRVETKRELLIGLGISDLTSLWLYYLTVIIGVVRIVKGLIWFVKGLFCRRPQLSNDSSCEDDNEV
ncbi:hypothetical protein MKW92_002891 [Papaver armeniacum]|nr:hypothetical protein MKW92_002891 [Papaver armeniacum]